MNGREGGGGKREADGCTADSKNAVWAVCDERHDLEQVGELTQRMGRQGGGGVLATMP